MQGQPTKDCMWCWGISNVCVLFLEMLFPALEVCLSGRQSIQMRTVPVWWTSPWTLPGVLLSQGRSQVGGGREGFQWVAGILNASVCFPFSMPHNPPSACRLRFLTHFAPVLRMNTMIGTFREVSSQRPLTSTGGRLRADLKRMLCKKTQGHLSQRDPTGADSWCQ